MCSLVSSSNNAFTTFPKPEVIRQTRSSSSSTTQQAVRRCGPWRGGAALGATTCTASTRRRPPHRRSAYKGFHSHIIFSGHHLLPSRFDEQKSIRPSVARGGPGEVCASCSLGCQTYTTWPTWSTPRLQHVYRFLAERNFHR